MGREQAKRQSQAGAILIPSPPHFLDDNPGGKYDNDGYHHNQQEYCRHLITPDKMASMAQSRLACF